MESLKLRKFGNVDCIVLPELNSKVFKKLKSMSQIKCWKNICISDNLMTDEKFCQFSEENNLQVMDGKWLFKNIVDKIIEFLSVANNENLANQEVSILCKNLDETIYEKIDEICEKVKVLNIITNNYKQFKKLEESIYGNKGIILNISNNYKKAMLKSNIIVNFDFDENDLKKCILKKDAYMINIDRNVKVSKKYFDGKNVGFYGIDIPEKYSKYQEILTGFSNSILYESLVYKKTSYGNIKKELIEDDIKILYLEDFEGNMIKNLSGNFIKKLDKITI